jgi:hypothetical protein
MIGVGVMAYAGAGLFLSDKAEEKFGLTPTDKDLEELKGALPKITTVDRKDRWERPDEHQTTGPHLHPQPDQYPVSTIAVVFCASLSHKEDTGSIMDTITINSVPV